MCLTLSMPVARAEAKPETAGALASYVSKVDGSYRWVKCRSGELAGGNYVELTLTSQTWRGMPWKHQLFVFKPAEVTARPSAILWVTGGVWRDELARPVSSGGELPRELQLLAAAGARLKSPVAVLMQVPRQPILGGLVEDQAISYTFEQYLRTGDDTWPLLLPMVKSTVRAMDAVQEFSRESWNMDVKQFTVTGASKRGWTTWLTAAVDGRVAGLAPMVIDVLNMGPQMKHQVATWGGYSEQLRDYTNRGVQGYMATPQGEKLRAIVDPYSYRQSIRQPKLILLGTNDRYWPLDALNLYWPALEGEKYVLYVPNNGHGLNDLARVVGTIAALHRHTIGESKMPQLSWKLTSGKQSLALDLKSDVTPTKVSAWVATSRTKDFRSAHWESFPATAANEGYQFSQPLDGGRYTAVFGEAVYAGEGVPYFLSTNVEIAGPK